MARSVGIVALLCVAVAFASNHIAARLAFDHGVNVPTAVLVRSIVTALAVFVLLRLTGTTVAPSRATLLRAAGIGLLLAVQSLCLYSAVARIPVALALLAFNSFPLCLALLSWLSGGERPTRRTLLVMPVVLIGLALALDVAGRVGAAADGLPAPGVLQAFVARWERIGPGVGFALAASVTFASALLLQTRWLPTVDGRLRTTMFMSVVAIATATGVPLAGAMGVAGAHFAWPADATGWIGLALLSVFYGSAATGAFIVLPRLGTVNNAAVMNFEPIAALLLGWAILGQVVAPLQVVGALVVVLGIVALSWR